MAVTELQELIKQGIVTIIQSIPNSGVVFDRVKYSSNWQNFKDQFLYHDSNTGFTQIRGWWVTVPTLREDPRLQAFDGRWHNFIYPIHAVMSYSDKGDTEPEFNNILWQVFDTLRVQGVLGLGPNNPQSDGAHVIDGSVDVEVIVADMRVFGSVLCHHAELRMTVGVNDPVVWIP